MKIILSLLLSGSWALAQGSPMTIPDYLNYRATQPNMSPFAAAGQVAAATVWMLSYFAGPPPGVSNPLDESNDWILRRYSSIRTDTYAEYDVNNNLIGGAKVMYWYNAINGWKSRTWIYTAGSDWQEVCSDDNNWSWTDTRGFGDWNTCGFSFEESYDGGAGWWTDNESTKTAIITLRSKYPLQNSGVEVIVESGGSYWQRGEPFFPWASEPWTRTEVWMYPAGASEIAVTPRVNQNNTIEWFRIPPTTILLN